MIDLDATWKDIEQLEDYDWPDWGNRAITKAYQAGERLVARIRELEDKTPCEACGHSPAGQRTLNADLQAIVDRI